MNGTVPTLALCVCVAALLMTGCSEQDAGRPDDPAASTEPAGSAACSSAGGEVTVNLLMDQDEMEASFEFADGELPRGEVFAVHVKANNYGADGNGDSLIASAKWVDDEPFVSIFYLGDGWQENFSPDDAELDGNNIKARFDARPFAELGEGWKWTAVVTEDGVDRFTCPAEPQPFAS